MGKQTVKKTTTKKLTAKKLLQQKHCDTLTARKSNKKKHSSKRDQAMSGYVWNIIQFILIGDNYGDGEKFFINLLILSLLFLITEKNVVCGTRLSKVFHNFLLGWTFFNIFVCLMEVSGILVVSGVNQFATIGISDKFIVHIAASLSIGQVYCIMCLPIIIGIVGNWLFIHYAKR